MAGGRLGRAEAERGLPVGGVLAVRDSTDASRVRMSRACRCRPQTWGARPPRGIARDRTCRAQRKVAPTAVRRLTDTTVDTTVLARRGCFRCASTIAPVGGPDSGPAFPVSPRTSFPPRGTNCHRAGSNRCRVTRLLVGTLVEIPRGTGAVQRASGRTHVGKPGGGKSRWKERIRKYRERHLALPAPEGPEESPQSMKQGHHTTLAVVRKLSGGGAGLAICVAAHQVRRTFEVTNLGEIIPVYVFRTEALSISAQSRPRPEQELLEETRSRGSGRHGVNGTGRTGKPCDLHEYGHFNAGMRLDASRSVSAFHRFRKARTQLYPRHSTEV